MAAGEERSAAGPGPSRDRDVARLQGLGLSWVAGAVDGLGYVLLHVFTAHVTGNTVHVGTDLGRLLLRSAARAAFAIAAFVAGAALGAAVRDRCRTRGLPDRAIVLALCGALLAVFYALAPLLHGSGAPSGWRFFALAAPPALAMGCQNAAAPKAAGRRVRTFITGTMTEFAEALVAAAGSAPDRRAALARAGNLLAIWTAYLAGGVVSGAASARWGARAVLLPIAALVVAVLVELRKDGGAESSRRAPER